MAGKKKLSVISDDKFIHKEGFMRKRTGLLRLWKQRYFVLLDDLLCYYLKEGDQKKLAPAGRIFICDIVKIERGPEKKSHPYALQMEMKEKVGVFFETCIFHSLKSGAVKIS